MDTTAMTAPMTGEYLARRGFEFAGLRVVVDEPGMPLSLLGTLEDAYVTADGTCRAVVRTGSSPHSERVTYSLAPTVAAYRVG